MAKKKLKPARQKKSDAFDRWKSKVRIERRPDARGTNLVDKEQPVVVVTFPNGRQTLMGRWTGLCLPEGCFNAVDATDEQIMKAIWGDEPVM